MDQSSKLIAYISDLDLIKNCNKIPAVKNRASLIDGLIKAYKLHQYMEIIKTSPATEEEITSFHSTDYINFLKRINEASDFEEFSVEDIDYFGLGYDCPFIEKIYDLVSLLAGSTLTAAKCLLSKEFDIVINWCGGWHHAQRDKAEGFCYVNDIVLGIQTLLKEYGKILYIDLDIHHGNGVENAFSFTSKVMTLSFHQFEPGFYPGSGSLEDIGTGNGKLYSINVPYKSGIKDEYYIQMFKSITTKVLQVFKPECLVIQCGADSLNEDPLGNFNLTPKGIGYCIHEILNWNLPSLFLGGGGYNVANAARFWTYLTSIIVNKKINVNIPEHSFSEYYGPYFELDIDSGLKKDNNKKQDLCKIVSIIKERLNTMDKENEKNKNEL